MYAGRIVEEGPVRDIFRNPAHPYTRGLLASIPSGIPGARLPSIDGGVPVPGELPRGCAFEPRCPHRFEPCAERPPSDYPIGPQHRAKCYLLETGADRGATPDSRPSTTIERPSTSGGRG
jgi:oligopeptide/dipeptide ABC transporter ATP-binding protein